MENSMENFANFIIDYIASTEIHGVKGWINQLNSYKWNAEGYSEGIEITKKYSIESKQILKRSDNEQLWHHHCENIRNWGGMNIAISSQLASELKKSVLFLSQFYNQSNCDFSKLPITGRRIATASKIYYYSDPLCWTIYDSRVGFALHQLIHEYAQMLDRDPLSLFRDVQLCLPDSQTKEPNSDKKRRTPIYDIPLCSSDSRAKSSFVWTSFLHRLIAKKLNETAISKPEHSLSPVPQWELPHVEMVFFVIGDRKWISASNKTPQNSPQPESQIRNRPQISRRHPKTQTDISVSFVDAFQILQSNGPALIISSRGTKYKVESRIMRNGTPVICARPQSGVIYIHEDCWGKAITCQGTRAGGIYNGAMNIFSWLQEQKKGE